MGMTQHFRPEKYAQRLDIILKIFENFMIFSCIIFWAQNILIPLNHILLASLLHFVKTIRVFSVWTKSDTVYTTVITCSFELDLTCSRTSKTIY